MSWIDSWGSHGGFIPDTEIRRFAGNTRASSQEALDTAARELRGDLEVMTKGGQTVARFAPLDAVHNRVLWRTKSPPKPVIKEASAMPVGIVIPTIGMDIVASAVAGEFGGPLPLVLMERSSGAVAGIIENVCLWSRIPVDVPKERLVIPKAFRESDTPT